MSADYLKKILELDLHNNACKMGLINDPPMRLDYELLLGTLGYLDKLSRIETEKRTVVTLSALIWEYREEHWVGLRDFLTPILTRIGYAPSSIMLDRDYDFEKKQFSRLRSFLAETDVLLNQVKNEICVCGKTFLLTEFQMKVWKALGEHKVLGISAPTSAGKSFILLLKIAELLGNAEGSIVYIVPTLSLISQVCRDVKDFFYKLNIDDFLVTSSFEDCSASAKKRKICVFTQERAISIFSSEIRPFENLKMLIVDEIQNLERCGKDDDSRSRILYDTLISFKKENPPQQIVVAGPRIVGLKKLGMDIFEEKDSVEERTKDSPVVGLTYSIQHEKNGCYLNLYCDLLRIPLKKVVNNIGNVDGFGGSQYNEKYLDCFSKLLSKFNEMSILFTPTVSAAEKTAMYLSSKQSQLYDEKILSLQEYIRNTVRSNYKLAECIGTGNVYHHGKLPAHVRSVVEYAIRKGFVKNIACTTTLMQGVNLPAQNVFLRNPDLAVNKRSDGTKPRLTNYEMANLRGRAGRLMKDFVGRTFVLSEKSFEENESNDLFKDAEKILEPGYKTSFQKSVTEIKEVLLNEIDDYQFTNDFLVTYIRQTILRYGASAKGILLHAGIELSDAELGIVMKKMDFLSVPKEICLKNRYWDPFVLDKIYKNRESFNLPNTPYQRGVTRLMKELLLKLKNEYSKYFCRYFEDYSNNEGLFNARISIIVKWMQESSLSEILKEPYYEDSEKINRTIDFLQKYICYGLPMLLKPFYDIIKPSCNFCQIIETGASYPVTRKMIEMDIPRETAITLSHKYFDYTADLGKELIISKISEIKKELCFWEQIQVDSL